MLGGPAAAPSSIFTSPTGGTGLQATYFASTDLSGAPIVTRTDPGVRWDQGFIGGGPAFASLYGSQLEPTPGDAGSARYTGTFTVPTTGAYTFALTGWGEARDVPGRRVRDRPRHRARRVGDGEHRDAESAGGRRARDRGRVPRHARVHRPGAGVAPARVDASRQRLLAGRAGRRGGGARRRRRGGVRRHVRERAARPRLARRCPTTRTS